MLEYVNEIRVAIESVLTIGSLWWTIRTLVIMASLKDQLNREKRSAHDQLSNLDVSIKKLKDSYKKMRDKIIPGQVHIMTQLNHQLEKMANALEKSNLPSNVRLHQEVKIFYTEEPDSRYFRSSMYVPEDETLS